ncbi:MAG TPA: YceH family protein [Solirubrobacteraceae bacterium]|nr:YceH family protein [Solirubrobacteraceae bacterium]
MNVAALELSAEQIRVLGCLLEKQRTTPDTYPLSLNALRLACNQSTNRDPVVDYDEATIREALERLQRRGLTRLASGAGSRAAKYRHLLAEALPMDHGEEAVMCVLMLRGPQTPGELKQRGERMHPFTGLEEVHETLERLIGRGLVQRLPRRPGQKEERYRQLLGAHGDEGGDAADELAFRAGRPAVIEPAPNGGSALNGAPHELEARVSKLEREMAELRALLADRRAGAASEPRGGSS